MKQLSRTNSLLNAFKNSSCATYLASTSNPSSIPKLSGLPEVIVAVTGGRANVGKSTFLNSLMHRGTLARTGKKAGRTRSLDFYRVGREPGGLVLVDSPGYGARGKAIWGTLWDQYISNRRELRGILVLINAPHGVTEFDHAMLEDLNERLSERISALSCSPESSNRDIPVLQPVFTKVDRLTGDEEAIRRCVKEVKKIAPVAQSPILCAVSPTTGLEIGIEAARMVICRACAR